MVLGNSAPWSVPVSTTPISSVISVPSNSTNCPGGIDLIINGITYPCIGGAGSYPIVSNCPEGLTGIKLNGTLVCGVIGRNLFANESDCEFGGFEFISNTLNKTLCYDDPNEEAKFDSLMFTTNLTSYELSQLLSQFSNFSTRFINSSSFDFILSSPNISGSVRVTALDANVTGGISLISFYAGNSIVLKKIFGLPGFLDFMTTSDSIQLISYLDASNLPYASFNPALFADCFLSNSTVQSDINECLSLRTLNFANATTMNLTSLMSRVAALESYNATISSTVAAHTTQIGVLQNNVAMLLYNFSNIDATIIGLFLNSSTVLFTSTPSSITANAILSLLDAGGVGGTSVIDSTNGNTGFLKKLFGTGSINIFSNASGIFIDSPVPLLSYTISSTNDGKSLISSSTSTSTVLKSLTDTPSLAFSSTGTGISGDVSITAADVTSAFASVLAGCSGNNCNFRQFRAYDPSILDVQQDSTTIFFQNKLTSRNLLYPNISISLYPDCPFAVTESDIDDCLAARTVGFLSNVTNAANVIYTPSTPFRGQSNYSVASALKILFDNRLPTFTRIWNVDAINGDDVLGDGSPLNPFKTIGKCFSAIGTFLFASAQQVIVAIGTYAESSLLWPPNTFLTAIDPLRVVILNVNGSIALRSDWATAGPHVEGGLSNFMLTANNINIDFTTLGPASPSSIAKFSIQNTEVQSTYSGSGRGVTDLFHFLVSDLDMDVIINCGNAHFERNQLTGDVVLTDDSCNSPLLEWHILFNYFDLSNFTASQSTSTSITTDAFLNGWDRGYVFIYGTVLNAHIFNTFALPLNLFVQNTVQANYNLNLASGQMCGLDVTYFGASCLNGVEIILVLMGRSKTLTTSGTGQFSLLYTSSSTTNVLKEIVINSTELMMSSAGGNLYLALNVSSLKSEINTNTFQDFNTTSGFSILYFVNSTGVLYNRIISYSPELILSSNAQGLLGLSLNVTALKNEINTNQFQDLSTNNTAISILASVNSTGVYFNKLISFSPNTLNIGNFNGLLYLNLIQYLLDAPGVTNSIIASGNANGNFSLKGAVSGTNTNAFTTSNGFGFNLNSAISLTSVSATSISATNGGSVCVFNGFNNASTCFIAAPVLNGNTVMVLPSTNGSAGQTYIMGANNQVNWGILGFSGGGTGASSFSANVVLFVNGAGNAFTGVVLTNGQFLMGVTSSAPVAGTLSGAVNQIAVTYIGPGNITISLSPTLIFPGSVQDTTGLYYSSSSVVAAGLNQGSGTPLTTSFVIVTVTGVSSGVVLPTPTKAGLVVRIINKGSNALTVYPASGGAIDSAGTNIPVSIPVNYVAEYQAASVTQWYTVQPILITSGGISYTKGNGQDTIAMTTTPTFTSLTLTNPLTIANGGTGVSSLTAFGMLSVGTGGTTFISTVLTNGQFMIGSTGGAAAAGTLAPTAGQTTVTTGSNTLQVGLSSALVAPGTLQDTTGFYESTSATVSSSGTTQGTATVITTSFNVVTTVAASSGVVLMTPAKAGLLVRIVNKGANTLNVYPASGGTIDSAATNAPVTISVGMSAEYQASSTTQWITVEPVLVPGTGISFTQGNGQLTITNSAPSASNTVTTLAGNTVALVQSNPGANNFVTMIPSPVAGTLTVPANTLTAGSKVRFFISGFFSILTSSTFSFRLRMDGVTIYTSSTSTATGATVSNKRMFCVGGWNIFTTGVSGTMLGYGMMDAATVSVTTTSTATTTYDTTATHTFDIQLAYSASNAANAFTVTSFELEIAKI